MNKLKFFRFAFIALLVINLLMLGFIFLKPFGHRKPPPREMIIERLGFDKEQQSTFDVLIKEHQEEITAKGEAIKVLKKTIYTELGTENTGVVDSLVAELGRLELDVEKIHIDHFRAIKKICKEEQLPAFKELTKELSKLFHRMNKKRRK